ncbi:PTS lactose/cellobiose transporter subunit IIA [Halanaerobium praevalens]|uniref:Phosphotransferase system PTS lactose/cellobiose-specific IIA subunit n=1 Tax=Halanaerobium praevalens (strain ATCC 33744 / DSM 2228 / GSL) TaxID=572479 RepID=E3DMU7_HALPG|nr:PTS lactose/cellobiose transporter subunit IIA [Halanaerobium praevalens]ADO77436.1 phosphotransferase system PTS lactose/cellobiose-specific IIA subunit [Halanaerobium praevalens DSM 2228]
MDIQENLIEIISLSGEVKKNFLEAIQYAKTNDFKEAEKIFKIADNKLIKAHLKQTELIKKEAGGEKVESSLLLTHAQDHLMTAILLKDMAREFIDLYQKI